MSKNHCDKANGQDHCNRTVSRRALLVGAGALGAALAADTSVAGDAPDHRPEDHAPKNPDVLEAVNDCVVKAQQCAAHCLVAFREGDTTLADCARKVNEMRPICGAFSYQLADRWPSVPWTWTAAATSRPWSFQSIVTRAWPVGLRRGVCCATPARRRVSRVGTWTAMDC